MGMRGQGFFYSFVRTEGGGELHFSVSPSFRSDSYILSSSLSPSFLLFFYLKTEKTVERPQFRFSILDPLFSLFSSSSLAWVGLDHLILLNAGW